MEQVKAPHAAGMPVWIIKTLAGVVTAIVCMAVYDHWKGYDLVHEFLAVALLAYLIVIPAVATWGRKERRQFEWPNLMPAYAFLMMATMLFGLRR
jgi:hypothetical protein